MQKRRFQRTVSVEVFRKVRLAVCVLAVVALLHVRVDACPTNDAGFNSPCDAVLSRACLERSIMFHDKMPARNDRS